MYFVSFCVNGATFSPAHTVGEWSKIESHSNFGANAKLLPFAFYSTEANKQPKLTWMRNRCVWEGWRVKKERNQYISKLLNGKSDLSSHHIRRMCAFDSDDTYMLVCMIRIAKKKTWTKTNSNQRNEQSSLWPLRQHEQKAAIVATVGRGAKVDSNKNESTLNRYIH